MKITLTAGQGVLAHGWWRARTTLTWGDILASPTLTFSYLLDKVELTEYALHSLQPDLQAWIKNKRAFFYDCPRMSMWDVHPIRDFQCDLGDLIHAHWEAHQYKRMGITFDDLLEMGLTPETMMLFGFTLNNWIHIGFTRSHCERIPEPIACKLFGGSKMQILPFLK